jgi:hypothetical protein
MPDDAAREEQMRRNAAAREAERGDYDPDRGDYDPDRGDYDPDRGDYDPDRGDYDPDRGAGLGGAAGAQAGRVATDIFRRASSIGGHLIVAFVAPISSSTTSRRRSRTRASASEAAAAAASTQLAALMEQLRQSRIKIRQQGQASRAPSTVAPKNAQTSTSASNKPAAQATSDSGRRSSE